jgi:hypothetical protein
MTELKSSSSTFATVVNLLLQSIIAAALLGILIVFIMIKKDFNEGINNPKSSFSVYVANGSPGSSTLYPMNVVVA